MRLKRQIITKNRGRVVIKEIFGHPRTDSTALSAALFIPWNYICCKSKWDYASAYMVNYDHCHDAFANNFERVNLMPIKNIYSLIYLDTPTAQGNNRLEWVVKNIGKRKKAINNGTMNSLCKKPQLPINE